MDEVTLPALTMLSQGHLELDGGYNEAGSEVGMGTVTFSQLHFRDYAALYFASARTLRKGTILSIYLQDVESYET